MRIHIGSSRQDIPPYNGIHEAYGPAFWKLLFQSRNVPCEQEFVAMPEIQRTLADFARSMTNELCMVVGRRGVGKTSVLIHMRNTTWTTGCRVIYECFRDESLPPPRDYPKWDEQSQRLHWVGLAEEHLTRILGKAATQPVDFDNATSLWSFFNFLNKHFPAASDKSLTPTSPLLKLQRAYEQIAKRKIQRRLGDSQYVIDRLLFFYDIVTTNTRHVKIIIDNLDDKHKGFIAALIEKLSHLQDATRQLYISATVRGQVKSVPVALTPFVSLRPITANALEDMRDSGHKGLGAGWNAVHRIDIDQPASLCEIVSKRYDAIIASDNYGDLVVDTVDRSRLDGPLTVHVSKKSIRWEYPNRDKFMHGLLKVVIDSGQDKELARLCNNDMSQAVPALGDVLKNRFFLMETDVLAAIEEPVPELAVERATKAISRVAVLKCLAYGNQGNLVPIYPVHKTRVVNIISGRTSNMLVSMANSRTLLALNEFGRNNRSGMHISDLISALVKWTRLDREKTLLLLDEMWHQGLVESDVWEKSPSISVGLKEHALLSLTPRAESLLFHFGNDTVLLLCYRDEVDLSESLVWPGTGMRPDWFITPSWFPRGSVLFGGKHKTEEVHDLFCLIEQMFCVEASEIHDSVSANGASHQNDFSYWFGTYLMTDLALDSLDNSLKRFYGDFQNVDLKLWRGRISEFKSYIDGWRAMVVAS